MLATTALRSRTWADTQPQDAPVRRHHPLTGTYVPGTRTSLERRCGGGGSGFVYQAIDQRTGKTLAVKVLREDKLDRHDAMLREIQILREVHSPWVVRFERSGVLPDGRPWFAMEYLDGRSLSGVLASRRIVEVSRVID